MTRRGRRGVGDLGEERARFHLEGRGYATIERGWTRSCGELDLVMRAPDGTIAFVEVKSARSDGAGDPCGWIGSAKVARLRRTAVAWLAERDGLDHPARFDVVCERPDGSVEHIEDAFPLA